jgi:hypothetical protein
MKLSESHLELLRRLVELPASERLNVGSILPGYAELKAAGYAKTKPIDGEVLTEITDKGRSALADAQRSSVADLNASNDE